MNMLQTLREKKQKYSIRVFRVLSDLGVMYLTRSIIPDYAHYLETFHSGL